jgi:hypothetical protein
MFKSIEISLHLDVKTKEKGERVLKRFAERFKHKFTVISFEKNVDDPSLFRVDIVTPLGIQTIQEAVFQTLRICSGLSGAWLIAGPISHHDDTWEFMGWASIGQISIPGVRAAAFEISNTSTE